MTMQSTAQRPESPATAGATGRMAHFVVSAKPSGIARTRAVSSIIDTMAVMLAGGTEPAVGRLAATLQRSENADAVRDFWSGGMLRRDDAARLYGMASHVLDYDDVSMLAICHPTAPVLAACLAAMPHDTTGRDLIDAVCVGTEVLIRTGEALGFRHYDLGFHATGTLGTLGAAAAVARLTGQDHASTTASLAIAASMSSGLRRNFGTPVKSLHVGLAAESGLRAVALAAAGFEASREPFETNGFLNAFSGGHTDTWPDDVTLGTPFVIETPGFELKRYPCCYMLHRMIHASLSLQAQGITLDDMVSARVDMPAGGTRPLIHPRPTTALEALFSGPYAVVASLADGRINLASFTQAAVDRPALRARFGDVELVERQGQSQRGGDVGSAPVTVTLTLRDGSTAEATCTTSPGSPEDPILPDDHLDKWHDCLSRFRPGTPRSAARATFEAGLALDSDMPVDAWLADLAALKRDDI